MFFLVCLMSCLFYILTPWFLVITGFIYIGVNLHYEELRVKRMAEYYDGCDISYGYHESSPIWDHYAY